MYCFDNKKILVTGSTRGIGRAIAEYLLNHGATVGLHGRDISKVKNVCDSLKGLTIPLACDLTNSSDTDKMVKSFIEQASGIDGLVNNAGGGKAVAFRGISIESWRKTFSCNLEAAMITSKAAYITMRKQKSGTIVNIASLAAHGPGKWMGADYAASKAGLVSLTQSLAFEAAKFGIRVNAVSPGMVETDMTAPLSQEMRNSLNIPMGRLAKPEEIASSVAFLLSDESAYITGQVLHVNGGL